MIIRTEFHHISIRRSFKLATLEEESQKGRSITATTKEFSQTQKDKHTNFLKKGVGNGD